MKVSKSDKQIKRILTACFPEWKGRKVSLEVRTSYGQLSNYWDGGSRCYVKAYELATGKVAEPTAAATNPFRGQAHAELEVPAGVLIVEHAIFCGKDAGVTIYANPADMAPLLPATSSAAVAS